MNSVEPTPAFDDPRRRRAVHALLVGCCAVVLFACAAEKFPPGDSAAATNVSSSEPSTDATATDATANGSTPITDATTEASPVSGAQELVVVDAADLTPPPIVIATAAFPLEVSDDRSHLTDQDGKPFMAIGDAAWSMLVQLNLDETNSYLSRRRDQGYNTLLINLIEHHFSDDPPFNAFGDSPFADPGDFSAPNPAYFDAAHAALERTAAEGFMVLLVPAYLGYGGGEDGWYQDMVQAGPDVMREYGRFVGERFGDLDNVIWTMGGDYSPPDEHLDVIDALRAGIVDSGSTLLTTAHWGPEDSAADLDVDWLDVNTTYTYDPVYVKSIADASEKFPHLVIESQYEDDIWDNTTQRVRSQAYDAILTGAFGSVYGNGDIWRYTQDWPGAIEDVGAQEVALAASLFDSLSWSSLVSDVSQGQVLEDAGTFGDDSYIRVAATPDRSEIVAYIPEPRELEFNLGDASGNVSARWFDPTSGRHTAASATLTDRGRLKVDQAPSNAAGDLDWVLVITVTP